MKKRDFLLLISLLNASAASAQSTTFRLGLRGGANHATTTPAATRISQGTFQYSADKSAIYAWQAGVVAEIAFRKFAIQPALLLSQKGEQAATYTSHSGVAGYSTQQISGTNRYNWLELPINVVYTLHGFQLFAGPYAALAVGGRRQGTVLSASPSAKYAPYNFDERIHYGDNTSNQRIDAGVNFGIGYRQGPLQVQLGYGVGFWKLHMPSETADFFYDPNSTAARNRVVQLTGAYFFNL